MLSVCIVAAMLLIVSICGYTNGYNDGVKDTEERWTHAVAMKADVDAR